MRRLETKTHWLGFFLLSALLASPAAAADQTTAGTATATAPSSTWLAFEATFTGDADRDGWTVFELGLAPGGPFDVAGVWKIPGPPEWRAETFRGLTPDTDYYVKVTFVDPDGVSGTNPQVVGPIHTLASAANAVTLGTAAAVVGDAEILLSQPISGDANGNSLGIVELATNPGGPWTEKCGSPSENRLPYHPRRCRLRSLVPGTDYWVRIDNSDPDGVSGTDPQVLGPITYTGPANLAAGRPITADPGWGCCPNPAQLVDGRIQYRFWPYGFAWTGGTTGYGGGPPGWKQATVDLGPGSTFDRVEVWLHGSNSPPTDWRLESSDDGASWSVIWATTDPQCRGATEQLSGPSWQHPNCSQGAAFAPVSARYLRYWFDDRTLFGGLHGWAVELEVFEPAPDPDATSTGTATGTAPSSTWLAFEVPFTGDADRDGWTVVELGLAPGGPFDLTTPRKIPGPPEWRADNFRGLTPDTDYYLRVTFVDPDGVSGANPQIVGPIRTLASAPNAVTLGSATATVGDTEIAVSLPISADANANSYGTVAIATDPGGPWSERCGHPSQPRLPFHPKRCRLRSLTPGTDYWVRVDIADPDGTSGTDPQVLGPITYTGRRNVAAGRPITADPGWGCCPNPAQLVDRRIQNQDWFYGFAWTGGTSGWAGGPPGWKQATIDLGAPTTFDRVEVWLHDGNSPPTTWKVDTSPDGASWTEVFSTTDPQCRGASEQLEGTSWGYPACSQQADFPPVTDRYVRYRFDDTTLFGGLHGWAVELEVFEPGGVAGLDIEIAKSESLDPVIAGSGAGNLTYVVTATKNGPQDATGLEVTETLTLPAGVTVQSVTPSGTTTIDGTTSPITWTIGSLASGASETLMVKLTVGPAAGAGTDVISDTAAVSALDQADTDPTNDSVTVETSIETLADLSISKSDNVDPVGVGATLVYSILVSNAGPSNAESVVASDTLPPGVISPVTAGCAEDPAGVPACTLGTIAAGSSKQYTVSVVVDDPPGAGAYEIVNQASVASSSTPDPGPGANTALESTTVLDMAFHHSLNQCVVVRTVTAPGGAKLAANVPQDYDIRDDTDLADQGGSGSGCGVPADATAVVLNVKAYAASGNGQVFVYPTGGIASPSVLNIRSGEAVNNMVTVGMGAVDDFSVKSSVAAHVVIHTVGYYAQPGGVPRPSGLEEAVLEQLTEGDLERFLAGESPEEILFADGTTLEEVLLEGLIDTASNSAYHPLNQCLVVRTVTAPGGAKLPANVPQNYLVRNQGDLSAQGGSGSGCGVPAAATAVVLNAKLYQAPGNGQVFVYPTGHTSAPSVVNIQSGETVNNMVTVAMGSVGDFSVSSSVAAHAVIHTVGYYAPLATVPRPSGVEEEVLERLSGEELERFLAGESPAAIVLGDGTALEELLVEGLIDTASEGGYEALNQCVVVRTVTAPGGGKLVANVPQNYDVRDDTDLSDQGGSGAGCGVPAEATAVMLNVKVYSAPSSGQVFVYPVGHQAVPAVINIQPGRAVNNMVTLAMGSAGDFAVKSTVPVHLVIHTVGYFVP